ncbi:RNA polymerase sigma factor, partial [Actinomadura kijaniata]
TPVVPGRPRPPSPPKPGTLVVAPAEVNLGNKKTAQVTITAKDGPVDWRVVSSSDKVTVSQEEGDLGAGASGALTIRLRNGFLGLPGEAELTFIDETGEERRVAVEWGVTLV